MQTRQINAYQLKIIAIIGMTLDHISIVFGGVLPVWLQTFLYFGGGFTFPIMAFLLVEGYHKTSNLKKYMLRLLLFGLASQIPFMLAFGVLYFFNIMFTLLLGLCTLYLYDRIKNRVLFWIACVLIVLLSGFCDWNFIGVPMILMYGTIKNEKLRRSKPVYTIALLMLAITASGVYGGHESFVNLFLPLGTLCVLPLLAMYTGERGKSMKYLFYAYYPGHLMVLAVISMFLGINKFFCF